MLRQREHRLRAGGAVSSRLTSQGRSKPAPWREQRDVCTYKYRYACIHVQKLNNGLNLGRFAFIIVQILGLISSSTCLSVFLSLRHVCIPIQKETCNISGQHLQHPRTIVATSQIKTKHLEKNALKKIATSP